MKIMQDNNVIQEMIIFFPYLEYFKIYATKQKKRGSFS